MKISILTYSLAGGGAERVVSVLLKELSKKYEVELVLMNDTIFYDVPEGVGVKFIEKSNPRESGMFKFLKLPFLALRYKKLLKNTDISLSFMNRPNYINILAKLFGAKSRVIVSERVSPSNEYNTSSLKDKISRFLIKFLYPKADLVVPNSKYMEYELNSFFGVKNTKVIYNPVEKRECKKEKNGEFVFIHTGRMERQKNHRLLIKAFKRAGLDAKLWLVGDGYLRGELEGLVRELGIEDKVLFLGRQKNVYEFLKRADCFVLSSDYEGFPNVLTEALLCGLPVISTDCKSGPREILAPNSSFLKETSSVEVGEYGVLTKVKSEKYLSEAMKMLYENEKLRYNYTKKAPLRALDFEKEKILKEWEKVIYGK